VYADIRGEQDPDIALVELIRDRFGGEITPRELQRASRKYPDSKAATAALERLAKRGAGRMACRAMTTAGGKPSLYFALHTLTSADADNTADSDPVSGGIVTPVGGFGGRPR